jgi:ribosomal protein S18 acetylase RimI-like enzyme
MLLGELMILKHETISQRNMDRLPTFRLFPYSCRYCAYWESTGDFDERVAQSEAERVKREWFKNTLERFGNCGFIVYRDDDPVGYAQYSLPRFLPRTREYASGPPSDDAVFLSCLYVPKRELRGMGIGRYLLETVESDLQRRGYTAIETFARKGSESSPAGPLGFYVRHGFSIASERDEFPLVRKELRVPFDPFQGIRDV